MRRNKGSSTTSPNGRKLIKLIEMEKIFNIVYQTVNTVNKKIYIGIHQTASLEFDGYIGNGIWIN